VSAAESQWPAWLRRRTGVEFLGPPNLFFARLTIALSLGAILYVGAWNAAKYPISLGYDAQPNAAYIHVLLDQHHIPRPDQSGEANQPPAYYFLAGIAARLGNEFTSWHDTSTFPGFPEASYRGAQIFNVLLVFLTALCVLWIARVVAPTRPSVWAASVGFFALLPVVSKTEAMLHPENLSMLTSAAALAATTHMLVRRTFSRRLLGLLAFSLVLGLATRTTMFFTVLAIGIGAAAALLVPELRNKVPWRRLGVLLGAIVALATPWVAYRAIVNHQGPLTNTSQILHAALHPGTHSLSDTLTSHSRFFVVAEPSVFTSPWRSNYKNEALPQTYTEIWGDWFGAFAWSENIGPPSNAAQRVLKDQSYLGVLPTALAITGWLVLCWIAFRRRRELIVLAAMPVIGVGGYLYRSWVTLTHDGDLFKATYALNTVTVWALAFGLATAWLASRSRLTRYGMIVLFAVFAILELRFTMYGIRDGRPIF
jgi:4-amino-4-deoxy-L-arabinose transferase-like glycosyltransferase